ncbi:nucleotidyltransferase [Vibrio sp. 10N.261.46.E12]|uniref:Y-family DNA polymerase n=1 Tax=unclassified Vibrio TaxID=2614977 RepID=UPI000977911E|nr:MULTISPECIES: nucleotidyltransferase [unclassified Vibrio]OMO34462.1 nucleotidyltransferase [Vibrio sp. 10N.261.45.E1]PMJ26215.1 nucleotidyltransferase [Vibrio sp. 10N.286.45.B6]PML82791.1 nucleotidyltransferase [Vibrio sp. 10N.261.49.E11]PMM90315.1 nucleotidyltransferase [Vibrio sp. 10N.261.46.E8]PMN43935.1 nucleotidyltransferase [Vibrio sp. 10N.261.45.E11]
MFALVDGTRFFANCSTIYKPELDGKPVLIVAGQGISIASNRKSSDLKIKKFEPIWTNIDKLRLHGGVAIQANFDTLGHISDNFQSSLKDFLPGARIYHYSVDESFIDLSHQYRIGVDLDELMGTVRKSVYRATGVATGAGVANTLTLAKCASWASKNIPKYKGKCVLQTQCDIDDVLAQMNVKDVWNIGAAYARHLMHEGITNALQLKKCNSKSYQAKYGINLANVISELNGKQVLSFGEAPKKQQVWSTKSYRDRLSNVDTLHTELAHHVSEVMAKVRGQKSLIMNVSFFVASSPYDSCDQFSQRITVDYEEGVSDTGHVLKTLTTALPKLLPPCLVKQPVYKVGCGSTRMVDAEARQYGLFDTFDNREVLNQTVDHLNVRFGKGAIAFASQSRIYKEKAGNLPIQKLESYFSNINQLIKIKCV